MINYRICFVSSLFTVRSVQYNIVWLIAFLICTFHIFAQKKQSAKQSAPTISQPSAKGLVPNGTIKIGVNIVASDPDDLPQLRSAEMAIEEINAAGGIMDRKLELITSYSETRDYTKVHPAIQTLINRGATSVLVTGGSDIALKAAELTVPKDVVLIASSASSPHVTNILDKGLVWRTIPSDVYQGKLMASLIDTTKYRTVGIIYLNNAYGLELSRTFREAFEKRNGKVITQVRFPDRTSYKDFEFKPMLDSLYKYKPDVIYLISYVEDGIAIINQSKKYGFLGGINNKYKPLILGCDGNYNSDFLLGVDTQLIETMMGLSFIHPKNSVNYERFAAKFKTYKTLGSDSLLRANPSLTSLLDMETIHSFAATSYDAIYSLAYAILKGGSAKGTDIAANMRRISIASKDAEIINVGEFAKAVAAIKAGKEINYEGASGSIEFDTNGDVTYGTYIVWRVSQGKFVEAGTISFP